MKELTGTERALEALGEALKKADSALNIANCTIENYREQVAAQREHEKMLEEALLAAEKEIKAERERADVLERRLEVIIEEYRQPRPRCETRSAKEEAQEC